MINSRQNVNIRVIRKHANADFKSKNGSLPEIKMQMKGEQAPKLTYKYKVNIHRMQETTKLLFNSIIEYFMVILILRF